MDLFSLTSHRARILLALLLTTSFRLIDARFRVVVEHQQSEPILGRVRLYFSRKDGKDCALVSPRLGADDSQDTAQVFGIDVNNVTTGGYVVVDEKTLGYPIWSLADISAGQYCVQADLVPYKIYNRGDGYDLKLPTTCVSDGGQNGQYDSPTGTLFSESVEVSWPNDEEVRVFLNRRVPEPESPGCSGYGADTEWIKTVRVRSKLLSDFWGEDMKLEACVLLPAEFHDASRENTTYPLVVAHGHYSAIFNPGGRFDLHKGPGNLTGYDAYDQKAANWLAHNWTDTSSSSMISRRARARCYSEAPRTILRRFVRSRQCQRGSVRQGHHDRADSNCGANVSRNRAGMGTGRHGRIDRRLGVSRIAGILPRLF